MMTTNNPTFIQENDFNHLIDKEIKKLWEQRQDGFIKGANETKLYWCKLTKPEHNKAILIVNGRTESVWKYQELFYEFFQLGFDVFSFDHRGQGKSDRITKDPMMGHIDNFEQYVDDMALHIKHFQLSLYQQSFLLCHSMGGTIGLRYLQTTEQHPFNKIALSAPMLEIQLPFYLPLAKMLTQLTTACINRPHYAPATGPYKVEPFSTNKLTNSKIRYQWVCELYQAQPDLQLGGPTMQWMKAAFYAMEQCINDAEKISLPLLLLQGENEQIVSNKAHADFIHKIQQTNTQATLCLIPKARHELFIEENKARDLSLGQIMRFFQVVNERA